LGARRGGKNEKLINILWIYSVEMSFQLLIDVGLYPTLMFLFQYIYFVDAQQK
jgi:hypothetical protein